VIDLQKICGSKVGVIVNNKFTTICVFLSYSYIFNDVTLKDILLKVFFMVTMPKSYLALGLIVTINKCLELGMKWAINIPAHYVRNKSTTTNIVPVWNVLVSYTESVCK